MDRTVSHTQPPEWTSHEAVWVAWPAARDLWQQHLDPAQRAFVSMCEAIADPDPATRAPRGERIDVLVRDDAERRVAEKALAAASPRFHLIPYGDIWLRDTAPIFVSSPDGGAIAAACFGFNGWGGKYVLPGDDRVALRVASAAGLDAIAHEWVLEGGSVEVDGEGTLLTTRQCLLHENRNPGLDRADLEERLRAALGVRTVLWLGEGLENDHTDGHVDTIARFVAPGVVACMEPASGSDPNAKALRAVSSDLERMRDARERPLRVVRIPSPGEVRDEEGRLMPASYVNFYVGNRAVVVPTYGVAADDAAVSAIAALFPTRRTVGVDARAILTGGGAFHCITQQQPCVTGKSR